MPDKWAFSIILEAHLQQMRLDINRICHLIDENPGFRLF
jgi:hypothetical protein